MSLIKHLIDDGFRDDRSLIRLASSADRLSFLCYESPGSWKEIADLIAGMHRWDVLWAPDTNVALLDETAPVWDAIRIANLGAATPVAGLSSIVFGELSEWLDDPRHHKDRSQNIRDAFANNTWLGRIADSIPKWMQYARMAYASLIGSRRKVAHSMSDEKTMFGTLAADKSQTMNKIKQQLGPRALDLAKKGRIDKEKKGYADVSDEYHCLSVIFHALLTRRDACIITADKDHLEIFYKAQWFLDTHYRAWLAANKIQNGGYGDGKTIDTVETARLFNGPVEIYERTDDQLLDVLPEKYEPIQVGVLYCSPKGSISRISFAFEERMLESLECWATTQGRCTTLFGEANLHVDLGPLKEHLDGSYFGVGVDQQCTDTVTGTDCKWDISYSLLDWLHSIYCQERFCSLIPNEV